MLRAADESDSGAIWEWRNDDEARAASLDTRAVTWADHQRWYETALNDPSRTILIGLDERHERVGVVRFDLRDDGTTVSINLAPERRGAGLGRTLLREAVIRFAAEHPGARLVAQIRTSNVASLRLFAGEGFAAVDESDAVATLERRL